MLRPNKANLENLASLLRADSFSTSVSELDAPRTCLRERLGKRRCDVGAIGAGSSNCLGRGCAAGAVFGSSGGLGSDLEVSGRGSELMASCNRE